MKKIIVILLILLGVSLVFNIDHFKCGENLEAISMAESQWRMNYIEMVEEYQWYRHSELGHIYDTGIGSRIKIDPEIIQSLRESRIRDFRAMGVSDSLMMCMGLLNNDI